MGREACSLRWRLWLPTCCLPQASEHPQVWGQSACMQILALPLIHRDPVWFLCASVYLSMKEGWAPCP